MNVVALTLPFVQQNMILDMASYRRVAIAYILLAVVVVADVAAAAAVAVAVAATVVDDGFDMSHSTNVDYVNCKFAMTTVATRN